MQKRRHGHGHGHSSVVKKSLPSPDTTAPSSPNGSENELLMQLDQKRRSLEEEIATFQSQKDREFRDFEDALRTKRVSQNQSRKTRQKNGQSPRSNTSKLTRTGSQSALDLLGGVDTLKQGGKHKHRSRIEADAHIGRLPSKPTSSINSTNIRGETSVHLRPDLLRTPTHPPKALSKRPSSDPTPEARPVSDVEGQQREVSIHEPDVDHILPPTPSDDYRESFIGVFSPAYLPLLDQTPHYRVISPTPLVTPPAEDADSSDKQLHSAVKKLPSPGWARHKGTISVLPLLSLSYPPHISAAAPLTSSSTPGSPTTKRAYTAPTGSSQASFRMPSALRTASEGQSRRKMKHVTFQLADSAIVSPSSSYEEGSSPASIGGKNKSGVRSPLRRTGSGGSLYGDELSTEEEEQIGIKPGMNMGDVMQRLHDYTIADDNDGIQDDADNEDNGYTVTKHHEGSDQEEDDTDNEDEPMQMSGNSSPARRGSATQEPDGYFSSKFLHAAVMPTGHSQPLRQRQRQQSPLSPYRDIEWDRLSTSDKDRLMFSRRRMSDDSDRANSSVARNHLDSLHSRLPQSPRQDTYDGKRGRKSTPVDFSDKLNPAVDGGSGIGFFELDEELATLEAGQVRPFTLMADDDDDDDDDDDEDDEGDDGGRKTDRDDDEGGQEHEFGSTAVGVDLNGRIANILPTSRQTADEASHDFTENRSGWSHVFGSVGSVPIDIVRPSVSVTSSWRGTFGH